MEASRKRIVAAYQAAARYYVKVKAKKNVNAREFIITFSIEEGPEVFTRTIEIIGNRRLKTQEILEAMETKGVAKDGVLDAASASSGILQDARMINDLNAIRALYKTHGMPGVSRCAHPESDLKNGTTESYCPKS